MVFWTFYWPGVNNSWIEQYDGHFGRRRLTRERLGN